MKNWIIAALVCYSLIVTLMFINKGGDNEIADIETLHDIVRNHGTELSLWAFGKDWNQIYVHEAIPLWNKKHPEMIIEDVDIKTVLKKICIYTFTHAEGWGYRT